MRRVAQLLAAVTALFAAFARADEPTRWEQLFFPFPIVGAPPQLEQQVQFFASGYRGNAGGGFVPSTEVALIATPHLGLVATLPYQVGDGAQPSGLGDLQLLAQYLAAGSLRWDDLLSVGVQLDLPTGAPDVGAGDLFFGPFVYAAQRLWHHLILELDVTALIPTVHGDTARQLLVDGLVSTLVTPRRFAVPLYVQLEIDTTSYVAGSAALPPGATRAPAETVFLAPEIFVGPVAGFRAAAGVFFAVAGDPVHAITGTVTLAVDLPNRFGY